MSSTDLWLRHLATRQDQKKAEAEQERHTAAAVRELWDELQRCATIFNFHSRGERNIKVFLRADDTADVIFARATVRLAYQEGQLQLHLITIAAFAEQEQEQAKFQPQFSNLGLLYWENASGQRFSTDMLVRHIFEHLLEHAA